MNHIKQVLQRRIHLLAVALLTAITCPTIHAAVQVLGVQYQQDNPYTNYQCLWHNKLYPTSCGGVITGANVHVYLKNTGSSPVTISDAKLAGYSLATVIKMSTIGATDKGSGNDYLSSIYYYWAPPPQDILDAGEPVWYKADPSTIPAGGVAQVVVRLRHVPTNWVSLGVVVGGTTYTTNLTVDGSAPQLASIGYSAGRTNVYLHWRRDGGTGPTSIYMDGTNVTSLTTTVGDPNLNFGASVISLPTALPEMSYHVYQGVYADGKVASASQRVWTNKFIYATYNTFTVDANYTGSDWIADAAARGFNNVQMNMGNLSGYLGTSGGAADALAHGYGYTIQDAGKISSYFNPDMWFLNDEPDAEEANQAENHCTTDPSKKLTPCGSGHDTGVLAMHLISYGESLRSHAPLTPTVVNIDGASYPDNLYAWGQTVDIFQTDPYYQIDLRDSYWTQTHKLPLYLKATSVYAVSRAACTAAEPNPHNVLLYANSFKNTTTGNIWPFPTPESKRIEVYYALAGGAKGLGYWWFNAGWPDNGLDAKTVDALKLWKEIGLLGNEVKTAQPLIVKSTPVDLPLTPSTNVWVRAVASGTDTLILYVVNDNYSNDIAGCHTNPVTNATLTATLPTWMQPSPTAFEITASGIADVGTQPKGNQLQVNLGKLNLTRMIVLTKDAQLRTTIQQRYDSQVRANVCSFAPELCVNTGPSISQQPANQSPVAGGTASFTAYASGSNPLGYRWQKSLGNLSDGGHYSGCTTPTLTITGASQSDVAGYRCVVTNAYGNTNSSTATLTLAIYDPCLGVTNADFESGFPLAGGGYIATNWTEWETDSGVIVGYDETGIIHGGTHAQRLRVSGGTNGSSGGVYQRVPVVVGQPFTASVWTYAGDTATACYLGVNPTGGTDPASGVTWSTANTNAAWVQKTVTGTATTSYITVYLKVASADSTKRNGYFDDAISAGCVNTPPGITQQPTDAGVVVGGTAYFSVSASGSEPLSYQWQKGTVNLSDGGHYAGSTTDVLAISSADTNDAGSYRCVVTNAYGSTNSSAATLTVSNATIAPSITQQPSNQTIATGGTASFTIGATGSEPLSYQWQKNNSNLGNGGHYVGATTTTLTISSADNNDAASYRCVVTNAYGSTNSSAATLSVVTPDSCIGILNPGFEDGFLLAGGGYIATNWTEWEASAGVTTGYDETGIVHGGAHSQRLRVSSTVATSGGVYQRVPVTAGNAYAVSVWIYADTALTSCYLGVDTAGGTNASSGVVWSSATTNVAWVQKTWVGTATANYLTVFYKVATPDNVKRNGYFDDGTPLGSGGSLQLAVQRNGSELTLLWPECPAAHLERADSLALPMSWTTATNQVSTANGQKSVTLTPTSSAGYFRLVLE